MVNTAAIVLVDENIYYTREAQQIWSQYNNVARNPNTYHEIGVRKAGEHLSTVYENGPK